MGFLRGKGGVAGPGWLGRALAGGLLLAGSLPAQAPPAIPSANVARALEGKPTALELRRRLAGLDALDVPALFYLAAEGLLPLSAEEGPAWPRTVLDGESRAIVRESLAARPRRELVPFLTDLAAGKLDASLRLEALRLLGSVGTGDHLKLLVRLTLPAQERGPVVPDLRTGFRDAMSAILQRDPPALQEVPMLFSDSPPGLAGSIVEALARQPGRNATRTLATLLGRSPGLDPLLLARLSERGAFRDARDARDESVFESVRRYLKQGDPSLVCAAALACGNLRDDGSVELLIGLVDHRDERVRNGVFDALRAISGLSFDREPARWTSWYHAELRWWNEEADSLLVRIERGRGQDFSRASCEVLQHRLFRDRIAESFVVALHREDAEEVRLACRALEQLASPVAIRGLVECMSEEADPKLREAACKALRAITGADYPPESDSWAKLLG